MIETYIVLFSLDIIALLFLSGLLYHNNLLSNHRKEPFLFGIAFTVLVILSEVGTILTFGGSAELRNLNMLWNVLGFALTPMIPIVLIAIFDIKILLNHMFLLLPTIFNVVLTILSPWFGWIFYVDVNNHYARGDVFFVFVAVYTINIIFLLISILSTCQKSLYPIKGKIISLYLFTVAGTCIQILAPTVYSSWHCVTLSLFLLYILLSEFDGSFDTLTGLFNRAAFEKASKQLVGGKRFSVIAMDINNFKDVNDTYGHEYGDTVLKEVAGIIRASFDNRCNCYRIGGDEFYIISLDANREKIEDQIKCMTNNLTKERQNDTCLPTVAYGYSIFCEGKTLDFSKILKEADDQMYYYKHLQKKD